MISTVGATDRGRYRGANQDTYACKVLDKKLAYGVVCDGMGGEQGGEVAAATACGQIVRTLESLRGDMDSRSLSILLDAALTTANAMVAEQAGRDPNLEGMGTTAVVAVALGNRLYHCHVGDSRAYLLRGGSVTRLTRDHTVVQMLLDRGDITAAEAEVHPKRHYITRVVGVADWSAPDYGEARLEQGDVVLLCSDGLYNMVGEDELGPLGLQAARESAPEILINRANELGGVDNITAILISGFGEAE